MINLEDSGNNDLRPRHCHVKLWPDFVGYGFHLIGGKRGHFINDLDPYSPAAYSGLKIGDKIIEVNGENICELDHDQVADLIITSDAGEVKILVVDEATEGIYAERG